MTREVFDPDMTYILYNNKIQESHYRQFWQI